MKKLMIMIYDEKDSEVGALGMRELVNLPSYENKTIKQLVEEMSEKNMTVKFKYKKITIA